MESEQRPFKLRTLGPWVTLSLTSKVFSTQPMQSRRDMHVHSINPSSVFLLPFTLIWLTLPAIPIALGLRLLGWTNGNWWLTGIVSLSAIALWLAGGMGGADAKGWLAFALLGEWMILSAALGMLIWYSITWICRHIRKLPTTERIPGFPGYWLGVVSLLLLRFCFQL